MYCIKSSGNLCFDWRKIIYAILIANALQIIFETSMLMALEV
jgi:hypothetical protein